MRLAFVSLFSLLSLVGCSSSESTGAGAPATDAGVETAVDGLALTPGVGLGDVRLGDTFGALKARLGAPASEAGVNHIVFGRWPAAGLEIVFASADESGLSDDATVLAVGAQSTAKVSGALRPGMTRAEAVAALGAPTDESGSYAYWAAGASARLADDGTVTQVGVFPKYAPESSVAEMGKSKGAVGKPLAIDAATAAKIGAVDMHLHPGRIGRIPQGTRKFIIASTPVFTQLYAPGLIAPALDPYAPFVGVRAQTDHAAIDHAVLFSVYTQKTTGWFGNEDLEAVLTDPRNKAKDGLPWAWGLASINFFDGYLKADGTVDAAVAKARLAALSSYFEQRRDLFIGIKLAHPHQQVAFDDARYLGVYEIAAKHSVPIYLHTGFSPFESAKNERAYYDPEGLRNTIKNNPGVKFILGHVGQGDALAVEHCLSLAAELPNVFLEISALNRPILRDLDGKDVAADKDAPQYPYVLAQVKKRGLVDKTIFGTDGPQFAGMVKGYATLMKQSMKDQGFTDDDIAKVLSRNFFAVFFGTA